MTGIAPNPRYRLYTTPKSYYWFFRDLVLRKLEKGLETKLLEKKICEKFRVRHAVCVPMARVGIYLTLKNLIEPGKKVILSPYTIADVINLVISAGGVPVFADIQRHTCNIDAQEVKRLITPDTGAVLITHLHGLAADVEEIKKICDEHAVPLIEDAAQAFGTRVNNKHVATFGTAGIYSLGMYKNITTWYGGIIVSENKDLIDQVRSEIAAFPYQEGPFILKKILKGLLTDILTSPALFKALTFWMFRFGYLHDIEWINKRVRTELDTDRRDQIPSNYLRRLTPFQARLALTQLDKVDSASEIRIQNAALYQEGLKDLPDLILPPPVERNSHIYTYFPIQYTDREKLLKWMMYHRRDAAAQHLKNCADLPGFKSFYRDCPNARQTANQVILLPTYPRYSTEEVKKNIAVIRKFFVSH